MATLAALIIGSALPAFADVKLSTELKDGDKISDIAKVIVKVESEEGVDKVEFRVDDMLRVSDTSTPYVYEWDTLADMEGEHTVTITGYDSNGVSKRITLKLVIDNELASGAQALGEKAMEALDQKDEAAALRFARRSQKVEKGALLSSRVVAKVYARQSEWDRAINALDKALGLNESAVAMKELASYRIQRAFRPENSNFIADFTAVTELRRKAGDKEIADVRAKNVSADGKQTLAQITAIGDALVTNGKYNEAVSEYSLAGEESGNAILARRALASVLQDKPEEAESLLRPILRAKTDDAAVRAVYGLSLLRKHRFADARATVSKDLVDQYPAALIVAAFADAGLGKRVQALAQAKDVITLYPNTAEAYYVNALATPDLRDSDKALGKTLALAPFQPGPLNNFAARLSVSKRTERYNEALSISDLVLKYYPDNYFAGLIQTMVYLQTKKNKEADASFGKLLKTDKESPEILMALSAYYDARDNSQEAGRYLEKVRKMEPKMERQAPPKPTEYLDLMNRKYFFRSEPFLSLEVLFPTK